MGEYTEEELCNLISGGGLLMYKKTLTGAEVKNVIAVAVKGFGSSYDPISLSTLPGVSGCKMMVSQTADGKYQLDDLLVNGESIKDDASFAFVFVYNEQSLLMKAFDWDSEAHDGQGIAIADNGEDLSSWDGFIYSPEHVAEYWKRYFIEGGKMSAPTDYIRVG